jgi:hypothetical protein
MTRASKFVLVCIAHTLTMIGLFVGVSCFLFGVLILLSSLKNREGWWLVIPGLAVIVAVWILDGWATRWAKQPTIDPEQRGFEVITQPRAPALPADTTSSGA